MKSTSIEEIEKFLIAKGLLKLRHLEKTSERNVKDFLTAYFSKYNIQYSTLYVKNNATQCRRGARRSVGDVFRICKYYFPNCRLQDVLRIIYLELKKKVPNFGSCYCITVKKRVFINYNGSHVYHHSPERIDEFGNNVSFYEKELK